MEEIVDGTDTYFFTNKEEVTTPVYLNKKERDLTWIVI